jgi:uncharacterized protein
MRKRMSVRSPSFLLILLPVFFLASCQDVKKTYWPGGKVKSVVHMKGTLYHGKAEYFSESGDLQLVCTYRDNLLEGPLIRYYPHNRKKEEQRYSRGKPDGLSTVWYEDGGKLSETTYSNGVLSGPYREYHPNQRIRIEGQYLDGFFSGRWLYSDFNGDIIGEGQFIHGTGKQRAFFSDGTVKHEVHYKDNLKDGEEIEYDAGGKIRHVRIFRNDTLIRSLK